MINKIGFRFHFVPLWFIGITKRALKLLKTPDLKFILEKQKDQAMESRLKCFPDIS